MSRRPILASAAEPEYNAQILNFRDRSAIAGSASSIGDVLTTGPNGRFPTRRAETAQTWTFYGQVGEFWHAEDFIGNCFAKIKLRPGYLDDEGKPGPIHDDDGNLLVADAEMAGDLIRQLKSPTGGQPQLLRMMGKLWSAVGEFMLLGSDRLGPDGQVVEQIWEALSTDELRPSGGGTEWERNRGPGSSKETIKKAFIKRIHNPHPRYSSMADSAIFAQLEILEEIVLLTRGVRSSVVSQLVQSGVYWVPEEMSFAPDPSAPAGSEQEDPFTAQLLTTMAAAISDKGSAASAVPMVARARGDDIKNLRHDRFPSADDATSVLKRTEAIQRFAQGVDLPVETITGHANCVDTETEILTADGWKTYDQLQVGEEVLTLNHESGLSEWQRVERVSVFAAPPEGRPMLAMEGQSHSSLSTLNHRWPVISQRGRRRWRESANMNTAVNLISAAPSADLPSEAKWDDAFVELVAWMWTEGHFATTNDGNDSGGYIAQSETAHPQHCAAIRRALTALCGPPVDHLYQASRGWGRKDCSYPDCGWPVHSGGLCNAHRYQRRIGIPLRPVNRYRPKPEFIDQRCAAWREVPGPRSTNFYLSKPLVDQLRPICGGVEKIVSHQFIRELTAAQLELFIQRSVDGDGWQYPETGSVQLHQASKARTEAFSLACILAGKGVTYREGPSVGGFATPSSYRYQVLTRAGKPMRVGFGIQKETVTYAGDVWCPTVANGTWMARRRGSVYFTGNTTFSNAYQISIDQFRVYIEPKLMLILDAITGAYLRPMMMLARGFEPWMPVPDDLARIVIWYDESELVLPPDMTGIAPQAHDRFLISDAAGRRHMGFSEDDAPDPEEMAQRIRRKQEENVRETVKVDGGVGNPLGDPSLSLPGAQPGAPSDASAVVGSAGSNPRLELQLAVAVEVFAAKALEAAGAKLKGKLNGKPHAAKNLPNVEVAAALGLQGISDLSCSVDWLLSGQFDPLRRMVVLWAEQYGYPDAAGLANGIVQVTDQVTRARLFNPSAPMPDVRDLTTTGRH